MFISGQGNIKSKDGAKGKVIFDDDAAACLFHVAANQPESDAMIFADAAGDAALEDPIAQRLVNAASLVGDLNDHFVTVAVDQAFYLP